MKIKVAYKSHNMLILWHTLGFTVDIVSGQRLGSKAVLKYSFHFCEIAGLNVSEVQ